MGLNYRVMATSPGANEMTGIARPLAIPPVLIQAEPILHFSVVIPAYNAAKDISHCLASVFVQEFDPAGYEVLLVDDCSTDATRDIASGIAHSHGNLRVMSTLKKSGPGIARNIGVSQVRGRWIIFLDSDDTLASNLLRHLKEFIDTQAGDLDAVGYNWSFASADHGNSSLPPAGRRDQAALGLNRTDLLKKYLCLHMDGSVIYTAVRRELITHNHLCFCEGYHEDVDYIFMVYWHARRVGYLDEVLYYKGWRSGSIVNTISRQHVQGFMRAGHGSPPSFKRTMKAFGTLCIRSTGRDWWRRCHPAREIYRRAGSPAQATELGTELYECLGKEFDPAPLKRTKFQPPNTGR
ncbi:MAG: glycosyltransferase family 2 protein [Candidatus Accumulibacter sp.]|nr:glycosyltransferase family 2 protein [Accumulibacter sp.]